MKTSEFIEKVEKLGFISEVKESNDVIELRSYTDYTIITVSNNTIGQIDSTWEYFEKLNYSEKKEILSLVYEYVLTPIRERKDKTIEEKAREYIQECINENHNFYSCVDNLLFNAGNDRENEIYLYYQTNSNEFVKLWCEVEEHENE